MLVFWGEEREKKGHCDAAQGGGRKAGLVVEDISIIGQRAYVPGIGAAC